MARKSGRQKILELIVKLSEAKSSRNMWRFLAIIFFIFFFVLMIVSLRYDTERIALTKENQALQKQIPVWTLKVECIDSEYADYVYFEDNYTDYELYKEVINRFDEFDEFKNCVIIK